MKLNVDIQKKWKGFSLDVAFEAETGCTGILGASGCGKSMTLNSIAGIVMPDEGRITIQKKQGEAEKSFFDKKHKIELPPQKRNVGYLFQNYALFPNMTVAQNIGVGMQAKGMNQSDVKHAIEKAVLFFHLEGFEDRYPAQLSGGQQQRVALARMLAYQPDILLFDEPFSAMDTFLREGLRLELLKVIKDFNGVSVIVTHDRDEAYQLCDQLILMENGRILQQGDTKAVFTKPNSVAAARLTGCKNISRAERINSYKVRALDWGGVELVTEEPITDDITYIGIRAHDFHPLSEKCQEEKNHIAVSEPAISEMPFEWYVTLKNGIWWKLPKENDWQEKINSMPEYLYVEPSSILLLK